MVRYFRSIIFWVFLNFSVIFLGSFLPLLFIFFRDKKRLYQISIRFFSKLLLTFSWIRVKVFGRENLKLIDPSKGLILAANHSSFVDSYVLLAKLPFPVRFTVSSIGFRMPFLKTIYKGAGYIGVGGKIGSKDVVSLFKALRKKDKIVIYSSVSREEESFEFSQNLIRLSNNFGVPILPVAIKGASQVLAMGKFFLADGKIDLCFAKPGFFDSPLSLKREILKMHASFS